MQNGAPLDIKRRKCRGIIYYLASHRSPISRDSLQEMFWPDQDYSAARHNFNVILSNIKKQMPGAIVGDGASVQLSPTVDDDASRLEHVLESDRNEDLAEALSLYRGDFLDGFNLEGLPDYESWKSEQREYYQLLFIDGLAKLAEYYDAIGEYQKGIFTLRRAMKVDPLRESLYRAMMRLYHHSGDIFKVCHTYQELKDVLSEEFGVVPTSQTRTLYDAMITERPLDESGGAGAVGSSAQRYLQDMKFNRSRTRMEDSHRIMDCFVGRDGEMARLEELSRLHGLTVIEGAPGSGKTRLVEEFMARWDGLTLYGCCPEIGSGIDYQPVTEAIKRFVKEDCREDIHNEIKQEMGSLWWNELLCFAPDIGFVDQTPSNDPSGSQRGMKETVFQFIKALSHGQRLLLVMEDMQWANEATISLLGYLMRQSADMDVCFVVTQGFPNRNTFLAKFKEGLGRAGALHVLSLPLLSRDDVEVFADGIHCGAHDSEVLADWLWKHTRGNPLQLREWLIHIQNKTLPAEGTLDTEAFLDMPPVFPKTMEDFIHTLFMDLSERAHKILDAASTYGTCFDFRVIVKAVDLDESNALDGLEELLANSIVKIKDINEFVFDHPTINEIIYQQINPYRRQWLHLRIAEALEEGIRGFSYEENLLIIHHFRESDQSWRCVPYALRAGDEAAGRAEWEAATRLYGIAKDYSNDKSESLKAATGLANIAVEIDKDTVLQ